MKEIIVIMIIFVLFTSSIQLVYGHKLLKVIGSNNDFSTAKEIPNHKISWGIYEELSGSGDVHTSTITNLQLTRERGCTPKYPSQAGKVL